MPRVSAASPGKSIAVAGARVGGLAGDLAHDQEADRRHRQVDPEDQPPVEGDQEAAEERSDRQRKGRDSGPDPSALGCSAAGEGGADRSPGRAAASPPRRRPGPTRPATSISSDRAAPESAGAGGERGGAGEEDRLAPEHVAEPAGGDDEDRDHQQVGVHHPLETGRGWRPMSCWIEDRASATTVESSISRKRPTQAPRQGPPRPVLSTRSNSGGARRRSLLVPLPPLHRPGATAERGAQIAAAVEALDPLRGARAEHRRRGRTWQPRRPDAPGGPT